MWWPLASVRRRRFAGVSPRREPIGADIRRRVGQLANQRARRQVIKAVEVFVVVCLALQVRVAVRKLDDLEPAMSAEAGLERVIRGISDE